MAKPVYHDHYGNEIKEYSKLICLESKLQFLTYFNEHTQEWIINIEVNGNIIDAPLTREDAKNFAIIPS